MTDSVLEQVRAIAADLFGMPAAAITADSTPGEIEAWDSVQHLNLLLELEQTFGVKVDMEKMDKLQRIGDIAQWVEENRGR